MHLWCALSLMLMRSCWHALALSCSCSQPLNSVVVYICVGISGGSGHSYPAALADDALISIILNASNSLRSFTTVALQDISLHFALCYCTIRRITMFVYISSHTSSPAGFVCVVRLVILDILPCHNYPFISKIFLALSGIWFLGF